MATDLGALVKEIRALGSVDAAMVQKLRREVFPDGVVSRAEASRLFDINDVLLEPSSEWLQFFREAIVDHVVNQGEMPGHVSADEADFLIERIARDGVVHSMSELELLIKVLETARSVPDAFKSFALRQVHAAVLSGEGDLFDSGQLTSGAIGADEVRILRRILFAQGSDGGLFISRSEAEALFDLADATQDQVNDPSFDDLFSKAIANHLFAASGVVLPERSLALKPAEWTESGRGLDWSRVVDAETWSAIIAEGIGGLLRSSGEDMEYQYRQRNAGLVADQALNKDLSISECGWLIERLGRDGVLSPVEKALIDVIEMEVGILPDALLAATRALRSQSAQMPIRQAGKASAA